MAGEELKFEPGMIIAGRYQVLNSIGSGGMGKVIRCKDLALDGIAVALKVLAPELSKDPQSLGRFQREASIVSGWSHPNIVQVTNFGRMEEGHYFIAMEFVKGKSLRARIRNSDDPLSFRNVLEILYEVGQAVDYAHQRGVIHRDIKPDNILLGEDGAVKLTDFGFARPMHVESHLTLQGETVGSAPYMSPEQIKGEPLDERTDVYSLGILAFEMVVGEPPFMGSTWATIAAKHIKERMPFFAHDLKLPFWFEDFVRVSLAKKREDRFSSVAEWLDVIKRHFNDRGDSKWRVATDFVRRVLCPDWW